MDVLGQSSASRVDLLVIFDKRSVRHKLCIQYQPVSWPCYDNGVLFLLAG